jgi:large subunit ribosomal protein L4
MKLKIQNINGDGQGELEVKFPLIENGKGTQAVHDTVVAHQAAQRSGTACTKNVGEVAGTNKKPWRQKGTGRARVGSIRTPLWRHGGTVFGPQPRSYDFKIPKRAERGALRAALAQKMKDGALIVVDELSAAEIKTKAAAEMLKRLGVTGKAVLVDTVVDEKLSRSVRNLPGVALVQSARLTAREVMDAHRVVATRGALEKLEAALA